MPGRPGLDPAPVLEHLAGLSSSEAAALVGVSSTAVRLWRLGRRGINPNRADALATRLGSHVDVLWPPSRTSNPANV